MNKAIFLDRDGVINIDHGYVGTVERFEFVPRAIEALKELADSDYLLIIITNQSGISKGYYSIEDFEKVMTYMNNELVAEEIQIDDMYFCMHDPDEKCNCRKPSPKMILDAAKKHDIDLSKSWMIGDKKADILCGKNAGCKTVFVKTNAKAGEKDGGADVIANDLFEGVEKILG